MVRSLNLDTDVDGVFAFPVLFFGRPFVVISPTVTVVSRVFLVALNVVEGFGFRRRVDRVGDDGRHRLHIGSCLGGQFLGQGRCNDWWRKGWNLHKGILQAEQEGVYYCINVINKHLIIWCKNLPGRCALGRGMRKVGNGNVH